jgi:hypothetical protein
MFILDKQTNLLVESLRGREDWDAVLEDSELDMAFFIV